MFSVRIIGSNQPAQVIPATHPKVAVRAVCAAPGSVVIVTTQHTTYRYRITATGRIVEQSQYTA